MEEYDFDYISETKEIKGIYINGINYTYSIKKSEKRKDSITIKLYDSEQKSKIYYLYEAHINKIKKDIEFLSMHENIDEIINSLISIFSQENIKINPKNDELILELTQNESELENKGKIKLIKYDINKPKNQFEEKIENLEIKYEDLLNTVEELKSAKENTLNKNEVKIIINEVLFDKDIQLKLFENMEQMFLNKYKLDNIPKKADENKNVEENIINKVQEEVNNKEEKINNQINLLQEQLKENIDYLKDLKSYIDKNENNNYIKLQVLINEKNLNKDVTLFNQVRIYKYFCNFEIEDIETIIDNEIVPIKFKNIKGDFKYNEQSKNCVLSQKVDHDLDIIYEFYWNFSSTGIHNAKIIFKKKLLKCNRLFYKCNDVYKIDCSNFDCSRIIDCSEMFTQHYSFLFAPTSNLIEINLGKLDFALSNNFSDMFRGCENLQKLNVSYLNINNAKNISNMFSQCSNLKEINASNFKTNNYKNFFSQLSACKYLETINLTNWDINYIIDSEIIENLINICPNLKSIKLNNDIEKYKRFNDIFSEISENGAFLLKKRDNKKYKNIKYKNYIK